MKFRTIEHQSVDGVPLTPGTLIMEPPEVSDTTVWIVEAGGWKRKLAYQEFLNLFPDTADTKEGRAEKRDQFVFRVAPELLRELPDGPTAHVETPDPDAASSAGWQRRDGLMDDLSAAIQRVRSVGGKADALPTDVVELERLLQDTPQAVIEDKIRHYDTFASMYAGRLPAPPPSLAVPDPVLPMVAPGDPESLRGAVFIASPELREWSTRHGPSGRQHMDEWFTEKCRNGAGPAFEIGVDLEDDELVGDRLPTLLEQCRQRRQRAHIWVQGDTQHYEGGLPRASWSRVWRQMDLLIEALRPFIPVVSVGLGFDLWEWVPGCDQRDFGEFHRWIDAMRGDLPGLIVGGRPQAPNANNNPSEPWSTLDRWNSKSTYYSVEFGKPTSPDLANLVQHAAAQHKIPFSENRDRMHNTPPYFTYTESELAQIIREYRRRGIACIIANWRYPERGRRTGPLPHTIYEAIATKPAT
jgi:hypothetical protein